MQATGILFRLGGRQCNAILVIGSVKSLYIFDNKNKNNTQSALN